MTTSSFKSKKPSEQRQQHSGPSGSGAPLPIEKFDQLNCLRLTRRFLEIVRDQPDLGTGHSPTGSSSKAADKGHGGGNLISVKIVH